ncbi:hypothetical protein OH77DRAFT_1045864 [Trametes cingulata]|nr:hypothetical protein OH77DRAFT_1045864 [Trametes cingulata]
MTMGRSKREKCPLRDARRAIRARLRVSASALRRWRICFRCSRAPGAGRSTVHHGVDGRARGFCHTDDREDSPGHKCASSCLESATHARAHAHAGQGGGYQSHISSYRAHHPGASRRCPAATSMPIHHQLEESCGGGRAGRCVWLKSATELGTEIRSPARPARAGRRGPSRPPPSG